MALVRWIIFVPLQVVMIPMAVWFDDFRADVRFEAFLDRMSFPDTRSAPA